MKLSCVSVVATVRSSTRWRRARTELIIDVSSNFWVTPEFIAGTGDAQQSSGIPESVSYTHLTLPTIYSV